MRTQFKALREIYNPYSPYMPYEDRYDIKQQPEINDAVGAVDRENATLEAEKGEVVVKPDLSGIYRIGGKRHYAGGTPLDLPKGSFIFSDDKDLHITPEEKTVFKFKGGGMVGRAKNTPARVIKREVDLKHYNKSSNIMTDKSYDKISKNSAGLMLQGYQKKLGRVAYVQEAKKGFPTGVPDFSQGTAPAVDPQMQQKMNQNPQYMQQGGVTNSTMVNPYTPKMMAFQMGGDYAGGPYNGLQLPSYITPSDAYPGGNTPAGTMTPKGLANNFNYFGGVNKLTRDWNIQGVDLNPLNSRDSQDAIYQWSLKNNPAALQHMWKTYGNTAQGKQYGLNYDTNHLDPQQLSRMGDAYADGKLGARTIGPPQYAPPLAPTTSGVPRITAGNPDKPNLPTNYPGPDPTLNPNPFTPSTTLPYRPNVPLSPLQKANLLYAGYQAATVPRFQPMRSQIKSPLVELNKYNDEPALNAIRSSASTAYASNRTQNPYLSGANNEAIFGKSLEAQQGVIGDYANRNVSVGNQQATENNQIQRQDLGYNTQANQHYYDQIQQLAQNYNTEKRYATNQGVSLLNSYMSQNQALEQGLASQRTYGSVRVGTNKDGSPIMQSKPLFDVDTKGLSPYVYYTGAGSLNGIPYMSNRLYDFQTFAQEMKNAGIDPNSVVGARYYAATKGQPLQQSYSYNPGAGGYGQGNGYKKGGMYGWMRNLYENPYATRR